MVKSELKIIALRTNKAMGIETAQMFPELNYVKDLHFHCSADHLRRDFDHGVRVSFPPEPRRHEVCFL